MILDNNLVFADAVATGNTGTRILGDVVDLDVARDIGAGKPLYVIVTIDTAITAGAGGTIQFKVTSADDAALTTNAEDHLVSVNYDAASGVAAGTIVLSAALPAEGMTYGRYIGVRETVATANTTAGKVNAFLALDGKAYKAYPQGQAYV